MLPESLATSADVLSSFNAFIMLECIIGKNRDGVKGKSQNTLVASITLDQPLNLH